MRELNILWVKVGGLWPVDRGGRRRSFEIIRALAENHRVTVVTTHADDDDPEGLREALPRCETVSVPWRIAKRGTVAFAMSLFRSWPTELPVDLWRCRVPEMAREVSRRAATADVCVSDFLAAAPNVPLGGKLPVVLFAHNVEHDIWRRLAEVEKVFWRRALLDLEQRKMKNYEHGVVGRVRRTIAVSDKDREALAEVSGADVRSIATGVDLSYFHPVDTPVSEGSLVFVGAMDWYPNEDAVIYFVEEILPRIRQKLPDATLTVVGRNPGLRLAGLGPGVRVTGTVEDVRPFLAEGAVAVVPLRIGGGTRLKIFEALAMGKAVVSTTVGAEGLPLQPDHHFACADDPQAFADAAVALLGDARRRQELGTAGRRLVEGRYGWPSVAKDFETALEEVIQ